MSEKDQARRDRPKAGPFVQNRLREEIERLETARAWRDGDRNAITLTKGTDLGRNGPTNRRSVLELGSCPGSGEKRSGAFFRLVKCTTNAPPCRAATGGTRA
jgi:hypothetical protein